MRFEEVSALLAPERLPYLSGLERLSDSALHLAVLTRMPRVSPRMIEWWFGEYEEYFGDTLTLAPGAVAICARPGLLERPLDMGRMVHLALPQNWGCELHSRFWLGYARSQNGSRLVETLGNQPLLRRFGATDTMGRALMVHCHEEMTTLAGFLPDLYASEARGAQP